MQFDPFSPERREIDERNARVLKYLVTHPNHPYNNNVDHLTHNYDRGLFDEMERISNGLTKDDRLARYDFAEQVLAKRLFERDIKSINELRATQGLTPFQDNLLLNGGRRRKSRRNRKFRRNRRSRRS